MSVKNFIPELWVTNIQVALEKAHVFTGVANRNYEGTISAMGDTVKINVLGDVSIKNYSKNADIDAPEELEDAQSLLVIDQGKYFNFAVDDVDKAQANTEYMIEATRKAGYNLNDVVDQYLAGMYAQAGIHLYKDAPVTVTSLNVEDVFSELAERMDEENIPREGRFAIIPPWLHTKLVLLGLTTKTSNDVLFANGFITDVFGFSFRMSNNVSHATPSTKQGARIIAGIINESFTFAEAILKTEAYRPERRFSDAIKGLHVYGGKVARPDKTATLYLNKGEETES